MGELTDGTLLGDIKCSDITQRVVRRADALGRAWVRL